MQKPGSSLPQRSLRELLFSIVADVSGIRLSPSLVLLDFREITADLVHRVISRGHTARRPPGQLADFQGDPSRTGGANLPNLFRGALKPAKLTGDRLIGGRGIPRRVAASIPDPPKNLLAPLTIPLLRDEDRNLRGSSATGALLRAWIAAR